MNKWDILGIHETSNPEEIKEAYMTKLSYCNPEDDPEGFIKLRSAYEEALQSLENDNNKDEDFESTPLGQFFKRIDAVYHDFDKRNNLELWKEFLSDEVCMRLDNMDETEMALLGYLMGHNLLSPQVWKLLDSHFNWQSREKLLKDTFPPNFINYVLSQLSNDTSLLYSHLQYEGATTEQIDQWLNLFGDLRHMDKNSGSEKFAEIQEAMEALPVYHAYYDLEIAKFHIHNQEPKKALEVIEPIYNQFPEDRDIWYGYAMAVMYSSDDRIPEALELFKGLHKIYPDSWLAKRGLIDSLYYMGEYEESYELVCDILKLNPSDYHANLRKNSITEKFIEIYEEKYKQDPSDVDTIMKLSSHYLSVQKSEKCIEILLTLDPPPQNADNMKYYENLTHAYLNVDNFDKCIELCKICINIKPTSIIYYLYATALTNINHDNLMPVLDEGIAIEDNDVLSKLRLYTLKAMQLFTASQVDEALDTINKGLDLSQDSYLYIIKGDILRARGQFSEAVIHYEKSQELDPSADIIYLRQIDLYASMDMYDEMLRVVMQAFDMGINNIHLNYYYVFAKRETGQFEEAQKRLNELFEREDKNECLDRLYEEAALLALAIEEDDYTTALEHIREALKIESNINRNIILCGILRHSERYDEAMETINNVLEKEPTNIKALLEKAEILKVEDNDKALEIFKQVIDIHDTNTEAYYSILEIYDEAGNVENVIHWAERSLEKIDGIYHYLTIGFYYRRYHTNDITDKLYKEIIEKYPHYSDSYTHYGYFLSSIDKNAEAIEQFKISLEKDESNYSLYESLAYYLSLEKRYEEALDILDKGEKQHGDNLGAIVMRRGDVLEDMLRYPEALQCMLKALEMEDSLDGEWTIVEIHNRIGDLYMGNFNDATNALHHYQTALELDEDDEETIDNLAYYMLHYAEDYTKSLEYYNRVIEINPDKHSICHTYMARGRTYKHLGKQDKAEQDFLKGIELYHDGKEKDFSPCWDIYIALAYIELKQFDKAQSILENMIDTPTHPKSWCIRPKCNECIHGLAQIEVAKNNLQKAIAYYEEAISIRNSVRYNRELAYLKNKL